MDFTNNIRIEWQSVFKSVDDLIIIINLDNQILYANPAVFKATGLKKDQIIGHACYTIFHCTEEPPCNCPCKKLKKSLHQESVTMEIEALRRKYLITVSPVFDNSGQMTNVIHIAKDITELKNTEKELYYAEKKFQSIFQAASDGILLTDIGDKKFVDANMAICKMLGYTRDEILKLDTSDIHPEKDLPQIIEIFEKQVEGEILVAPELPVKRKDNSIFYADISARSVTIGKQKVLIGIFRDMTPRIQSEKLLKEEKENAQRYLDMAGVMLLALNTEGKITLLNQKGCNILKIDENDALGKSWFECFIPKEVAIDVKNVFMQIMAGDIQSLKYYENQIVTQNGELKTIAFHNTVIKNDKGVIIGILSSGEDITDRKKSEEIRIKLEQQIQKNEKLESLGILAGGIAHDFNNILAAILGNINLATFDKDIKDKTRQLLHYAERATLRAKDLTQQLLTFSKGGDPVKGTASLDTVIKESANFILHGDKVACQYNIPENLWLVDIDKGQIGQVIQNIVINASNAMPEGGIISISCKNISSIDQEILSHKKDDKFIKISIQDNGIGIPEKLINKIFDPYFSTKQKGSGLGLSICQSIINKHDGEILVESSPGHGTTFHIYLPASDKIKPQVQAKNRECNISSQAKILIMDDEEMMRDIFKAMLTRLGNKVILSKDGAEAVKLYKEAMDSDNPIQLVIMDLTIPGGMGGKDAVQKIHDLNTEAKVIVSSGYSSDPVMSNFKEYGFCAALIKPFRLHELSAVIDQTLSL